MVGQLQIGKVVLLANLQEEVAVMIHFFQTFMDLELDLVQDLEQDLVEDLEQDLVKDLKLDLDQTQVGLQRQFLDHLCPKNCRSI